LKEQMEFQMDKKCAAVAWNQEFIPDPG